MTIISDLGLTEFPTNPASPDVTINENDGLAYALLLAGVAKGTATPPGSPAEGDVHIIGASPTGAWSAFSEDNLAQYHNGAWREVTPVDRLHVWIDSGSTTSQLWKWDAGGAAWNQIEIGTASNAVRSDTTTTISVGYAQTSYNAGTKSSGTFTPSEANGGFQRYVNGGAHALAPPTNATSLCLQMTNNDSAGAVTTTGFTAVSGDTISTTDGDDFMLYINKNNGFSHLHVVALQ